MSSKSLSFISAPHVCVHCCCIISLFVLFHHLFSVISSSSPLLSCDLFVEGYLCYISQTMFEQFVCQNTVTAKPFVTPFPTLLYKVSHKVCIDAPGSRCTASHFKFSVCLEIFLYRRSRIGLPKLTHSEGVKWYQKYLLVTLLESKAHSNRRVEGGYVVVLIQVSWVRSGGYNLMS